MEVRVMYYNVTVTIIVHMVYNHNWWIGIEEDGLSLHGPLICVNIYIVT